jgi:hypothetical protein
MMNGPIGLPSRLALFVCGMISIVLSNAFRVMQVLIPDAHVKWRILSAVLFVVGGLTAVIALLPSSWLGRACKIGPDSEDRSSVPIKLLGGFAGFSYLLTVGLDLAPHSWHPTAQAVYLLCPACVLTITVDPSFGSVLLVLAPLNAVVYGSLGAVVGFLLLAIRNRLR